MAWKARVHADTTDAQAARRSMVWLFLGAIGLLAALSLRTPLNHDEGQYIAAAHLVATGLSPYRDFPYLQTPLQPLLLAPVVWMTPGWTLIGLRLVNALFVAIAILLIGRTASSLARDDRAGVVAMLLALVTDPLLFAGSVSRNDALPLMLIAGALECSYAAPGPFRPSRAFLVGLLLGAAASAKISYALPAAAICVQLLWQAREPSSRRALLALMAGSFLGLSPTVYFALLAPHPFLFQVFSYNAVAPSAWAALKGQSWRLTFPVRTAEWVAGMMQGPLLAMLVVGSMIRWRLAKPSAAAQSPFVLGPVVAAAALASVLPMPSLRQYLVPLAAPLIPWFVALAWPRRPWPSSRRVVLVSALVAIAGVARSVLLLVHPSRDESPLRVEQEAHDIGRLARQAGATSIATLEPVHAADSGIGLDPRFATGQFLFRAGDVSGCSDPALCPITTASIQRLDAHPPDAILTGTQHKHPETMPGGLDGLLDAWAASNGYRPVAINRLNLLWLAPQASRPKTTPSGSRRLKTDAQAK